MEAARPARRQLPQSGQEMLFVWTSVITMKVTSSGGIAHVSLPVHLHVSLSRGGGGSGSDTEPLIPNAFILQTWRPRPGRKENKCALHSSFELRDTSKRRHRQNLLHSPFCPPGQVSINISTTSCQQL